ncbi:MAG: VTT domain-containing protein [bacterium]|nr:VTT domain-containing protein [bacterium]
MNRKITKSQFLVKNLVRGLIWFAVIIAILLVLKNWFGVDYNNLLDPLDEKPILVFGIFTISEVFFGIIPPELFMVWALRNGIPGDYIGNVFVLSMISYLSGVLGFYIGKAFHRTNIYKKLEENFFDKYKKQYRRYGGFLVIVAAATPLPFSLVCMLTGAFKFPLQRFLLMAATRFLRFAIYAYFIWTSNLF